LTAEGVDYTCKTCAFKSDICGECQDMLFPTSELTSERFETLRKLRILNQCPEGVGCQDEKLKKLAQKYANDIE
jgi:hypothetical protein